MKKSVNSLSGGMSCIPEGSTCIGDGKHMWERTMMRVAKEVSKTQDGQMNDEDGSTDTKNSEE